MSEKAFNSWDEFLNPDKLKLTLTQASIYLTSYEIFKNSTKEKLRDFFTDKWELNEETEELVGTPNKDYKKKVLDLYPKDEFHACCLWFKNMSALDDNDLMDIALIRKHRNQIAHELPKFLSGQGKLVSLENLNAVIKLESKLSKWWLREVELPTNPDVDEEYLNNIDWEVVLASNTILHNLLSSIFNGDDSYLRELHQKFITKWHNTV
jgi:nuclear transport factor 2 (NTF2) superfamily protein